MITLQVARRKLRSCESLSSTRKALFRWNLQLRIASCNKGVHDCFYLDVPPTTTEKGSVGVHYVCCVAIVTWLNI